MFSNILNREREREKSSKKIHICDVLSVGGGNRKSISNEHKKVTWLISR